MNSNILTSRTSFKITLTAAFFLISLICAAQNKEISKGPIFDGEPYIAINPNDPHHMVVAWMSFVPANNITIKTTVSKDAGLTWSSPKTIQHANPAFGSADPSLGFNKNGDVYLAYIDFSRPLNMGSIFVRKSVDGGINWGTAAEVINIQAEAGKLPIDRPWIAVDNSNQPTAGSIYVTSMNADGATPPFNPYFNVSTDDGQSFGNWKHLDTAGQLAGSLVAKPMPTPVVSSNGTFYAIYPSFVLVQGAKPKYILASSKNRGKDFTYNTVLASSVTFNDTLAKKGYLLRSNPSNPDHLAFFFLYSPDGDADIYVIESMDEGKTWGLPQRINDDPKGNNRMQDLVWADFDNDGDLIVAWRDRRNSSDSSYQTASEIWASFRHKDSSGFAANFMISDMQVAFDSILNESGNDFMSIQLVDDTLSAVWGDTRTGFLSIWFQRMTVHGKLIGIELLNKSERILVYPNPAQKYITVEGENIMSYEIYDNRGAKLTVKEVKPTNKLDLTLENLPVGSYLLRIFDNEGSQVTRIIKE